MPGNVNTETNQTSQTINLPDESRSGVENPPPSSRASGGRDDEQLPPSEVPGKTDIPKDVPAKGAA